MESCLWTAAKHTFVLPKELRVPEVKPACQHDFERAMGHLAARLGTNTYVMGQTFTVPDLLLGHCAGWAKSMGWAIPQGPVAEYMECVRSRPAAVKAMAARDAT